MTKSQPNTPPIHVQRDSWPGHLLEKNSRPQHLENSLEVDLIRQTNHADPIDQANQVERAADIIRSGGVVIFPTKCLYGLAADALNPSAVARIFEIKQRPTENPLLILINELRWLEDLVIEIPKEAKPLMKTFWPGDLTLIFKAKDHLPEALTAGTGKIGIRMPWHPMAKALAAGCGRPITGTSANISGAPGCRDISRLDQNLIHQVDMVLDGGRLKGGMGSTVVDLTGKTLWIVREGEVKKEDLFSAVKTAKCPCHGSHPKNRCHGRGAG